MDVVADVGVEPNDCVAHPHRAAMLQFVSGLGPRKARALLDAIRAQVGSRRRRRRSGAEARGAHDNRANAPPLPPPSPAPSPCFLRSARPLVRTHPPRFAGRLPGGPPQAGHREADPMEHLQQRRRLPPRHRGAPVTTPSPPPLFSRTFHPSSPAPHFTLCPLALLRRSRTVLIRQLDNQFSTSLPPSLCPPQRGLPSTAEVDLLDGLRIHPESYKFAVHMARDALQARLISPTPQPPLFVSCSLSRRL